MIAGRVAAGAHAAPDADARGCTDRRRPASPVPSAPRSASVGSGRGVLLVALLLLGSCLAACGREEIRPQPRTYVVQSGDTLYSIARRHGLDWRELARWNRIGGDYRIQVGQVLVLGPGAARGAPVARERDRATAPPAARPAAARPPDAAAVAAAAASIGWRWPADGRLVGRIEQPSGGVGLRIDGELGQDVRAAAPGRVVYTGAGLRAYGQLVIVKHDEVHLSAYGHNREVFVREGDAVRAGQRIAAMGVGPGNQPQLYFEIRSNGRPIDPLPLLPARRE